MTHHITPESLLAAEDWLRRYWMNSNDFLGRIAAQQIRDTINRYRHEHVRGQIPANAQSWLRSMIAQSVVEAMHIWQWAVSECLIIETRVEVVAV